MAIEDSAAGIAAAKKAGLFCIALATSHPRKMIVRADRVVRSFREILRLRKLATAEQKKKALIL